MKRTLSKYLRLSAIVATGALLAIPAMAAGADTAADSLVAVADTVTAPIAEVTEVVVDETPVADAIVQMGDLARGIDTVWMLLAAMLVFFMQPGFALVEAGFTRTKNTANILMKNFVDFTVGSLLFWFIGFGLMFGDGGFVGMPHFFDCMFHDPNGLPNPRGLSSHQRSEPRWNPRNHGTWCQTCSS